MSTNAESAQKWLTDQTPSDSEIQAVIDKLTHRLDSMEPDHPSWSGSLQALDFLQAHLLAKSSSASQPLSVCENSQAVVATTASLDWDISGLGDPQQPEVPRLSKDEKQKRFAQLKAQYALSNINAKSCD